MISWLKQWLKNNEYPKPDRFQKNLTLASQKKNPNEEFYNNYFSLIAKGVRLKLVEAMFSLNVFALFENKTWVSETEIIEKLGLMPVRAKKWLHLLCSEHFLIKLINNDNQPTYRLPDPFIELMRSKGRRLAFFFSTWQVGADEDLTDVLQFGQVKVSVSWPPKTDAEVYWLENWMTKTAQQPVYALLESIDFKKVRNVLDVGGGDGTMACDLVTAHSHLKATVYNLPKPAEMARRTIEARQLSHQVSVLEADFIKEDAFPLGFDLILFTRVLFDWDESVDRKLLRMAYQALPKNGQVAICEFYKEDNNDHCLAAEYRYIFHDDFSPNVMKYAVTYRQMLEKIGFTIAWPKRKNKPGLQPCSVILARK